MWGLPLDLEYDDCVTFFNGFFPSPGAWDFRHIPAEWRAA
jgi:hypothetical protein